MSLNFASILLGMTIAPIIGGLLLDLFSFEAMAITLGSTGFIAAAIFYFLTKDPIKTQLGPLSRE